jgi:hypothetical protein
VQLIVFSILPNLKYKRMVKKNNVLQERWQKPKTARALGSVGVD